MLTCSSVRGNQYIQGAALVLWNRSSRSFTGGSSGLSEKNQIKSSQNGGEMRSVNILPDLVFLTFLFHSLLFALASLSASSVP